MTWEDEIEAVRLARGGTVRKIDVLEAAKDKNSALHSQFDWKNTVAGHKWRLHQAGQLIRAVVRILPNAQGEPVKVRALISLPSDRLTGGGFRVVEDVIADPAKFLEYKSQLLAELMSLRDRYNTFVGLSRVISLIDNAILMIKSATPDTVIRMVPTGDEPTPRPAARPARKAAKRPGRGAALARKQWRSRPKKAAAKAKPKRQ